MNYHFIDPDKITELLFEDSKYVVQFCEAGLSSLEEFIESYRNHLLNRNMEALRQAGHKIKPGAKMMGAVEVIEEYENAKALLRSDAKQDKLVQSADRMKEICSSIQNELSRFAQNQK